MKRLLASVALMTLVTACATPYRPIPFDRATSGISTIQVVEDAVPAKSNVRKLATNGQNMASATGGLGLAGLVVGLAAAGIEAGIADNQNKKINGALESQKFDGEAVFDAAFEAELKAQNFDIAVNKTARAENHGMVVIAPQPDAAAGTAVLDINGYAYGYQQVGGTKNWRPYVVVKLMMYDAKDPKNVLLDNQVEYNAVAPVPLTVNVPVDETYTFESAEAIAADPVKATEGLTKAIEASARAAAQLLK
ncbi:hypothetical protein ABI_45690 [Asticcacaulis biprosthecium C19]|uniref:Lipoprotein n=1 Tax=Asticcacaulis biprosthecium C19 TaxID=715226 RepID=F4QTS2_9CAUL|nr:hypothetical protein [Asticcacaulis biprosthecium]EGF89222.1 hypothetical protein ABI_45690 [Asticcacaulis biprosthecium C19]